jgi:DNA-binding MarR family transcriptional regulator
MAIEGPLKELGVHDVFQLLDLSRKTGVMRITSHLRNNEGMVAFDGGAIVYAEIKSNPHRIGDMLVRAGKVTEGDLERARAIQEREGPHQRLGQILVSIGALSARDLERQVEFHVAEVVFELLSWQEGFFSFAEGTLAGVPADAMVKIRTESLLMEGARRIDEWSRIESHVPHLGVIPGLAAVEDGAGAQLDLLPAEWEVLAEVDGERDVRQIAGRLARSEFEVARTLFGLVATGVIELRDPGATRRQRVSLADDAGALLATAELRLETGDIAAAKEAALAAASLRPGEVRVHVVLARAHLREGRPAEAVEEGRRAVRLDPESLDAHRWLALALTVAGRYREAAEQYEQWERLAGPDVTDEQRQEVGAALEAARTLERLLGGARG